MAGHWTDLFSFVGGAIRETDLGYLILSDDSASQRKLPLAGIVQWEPDGWADGGQVDWLAVGAAVTRHPSEQLIVAGESGRALLLGGGDRHEEAIRSKGSEPAERGPLRGVRRIGETIFVVGMDRQVYRRDGVDAWSSFEKGIPRDASAESVSGFEAVDGFDERDLYAVGWDGEIWNCVKGRWRQEASPTAEILLDVCCGGDGLVYACGRNGLLVRGKRGSWEQVDLGSFGESLWSLAWFEGSLYASSMEDVWVLKADAFQRVSMGSDQPRTCCKLVTGAGLMWSIGAKDVMSYDGNSWTRID